MGQNKNNTTNKRQGLNILGEIDFKLILKEIFTIRNIAIYILTILISLKGISVGNYVFNPFGFSFIVAAISSSTPIFLVYIISIVTTVIGFGISKAVLYLLYSAVLLVGIIFSAPAESEDKSEKLRLGKHLIITTVFVNFIFMMVTRSLSLPVLVADSVLMYVFYKVFVNAITVIRNYSIYNLLSPEQIGATVLTITIGLSALTKVTLLGFNIYHLLVLLLIMYVSLRQGIRTGTITAIVPALLTCYMFDNNYYLLLIYMLVAILFGLATRFKKLGISIFAIVDLILVFVLHNKINIELLKILEEVFLLSIISIPFTGLIRGKIIDLIPKIKLLPEGTAGIEEGFDSIINIEEIIEQKSDEENKSKKDKKNKKENKDNNKEKNNNKNTENKNIEELLEKEKQEQEELENILEEIKENIKNDLKILEIECLDVDVIKENKESNTHVVVQINIVDDEEQELDTIKDINKIVTKNVKEDMVFAGKDLLEDESKINVLFRKKDNYTLDVATVKVTNHTVSSVSFENLTLKDNKRLLAITELINKNEFEKKKQSTDEEYIKRPNKILAEIIGNILTNGFDEDSKDVLVTALDKASETVMPTVVDVEVIDLYNGKISLLKQYSNPTYLKRGSDVIIIKSSDELMQAGKIDTYEKQLEDDDIVVICSNDVIQSNNEYANSEIWIKELLDNTETRDPERIANSIKNQVLDYKKYKRDDDRDFGIIVVRINKKIKI